MPHTYQQEDGGDGGGGGGEGHPEEIQPRCYAPDAGICNVTGSGWPPLRPGYQTHPQQSVCRFCVSEADTCTLGSPFCAVSSASPPPR